MIKKVITGFVAMFISSCSNNLKDFPEKHFNQDNKYVLLVSSINKTDNNLDQEKSLSIDIPLTPKKALKNWIDERLDSVGGEGKFKVTIIDSSIKEEIIPKTQKGFEGKFYNDQILYTAKISAKFELLGKASIFPVSEMNVSVNRKRSIDDISSIYQKKKLCYEIVNDLINDFDQEFEKNFKDHFSTIISIK